MLLKGLRGECRHGIKGPASQPAGARYVRPIRPVSLRGRGAPLFAIWKTARPWYRRFQFDDVVKEPVVPTLSDAARGMSD